MRGLVVLAAALLLASLIMGNVTTAETKKEPAVTTPAVISCTASNGTYITFKANVTINNLSVGNLCKKNSVPAGWTIQCYTSDVMNGVDVSFATETGPKRTHVTCS